MAQMDTPRARRLDARLDAIDMRILRLLSEDSRQSQRSLARELSMSPPAVGERIVRLERAGVIRGYTVDIDWADLGLPMVAFIDVVSVQGAVQRRLLARLSELPSVDGVDVVTGSSDLRVHLRVRDHTHLREVLFGEILPLEEIQRTETLICLESMPHKNFAAAMLAALIEKDSVSRATATEGVDG